MAHFPAPQTVVDPSAIELESLLTSFRLAIPDYQRPFTWRTKNWSTVWDDLVATSEVNVGRNPKDYETHFLGPVVVVDGEDGRTQVIDGQQRLTYLTVLIACLMDEAVDLDARDPSGNSDWASELQAALQFQKSGKKQLRLLPAPGKVRDALEKLILKSSNRTAREKVLEGLPKSQSTPDGRLSTAFSGTYERIDDYLAKHAADRDQALVALIQTLTQCLVAIQVDVKSEDSVFDVFERLNARGVPLGQADLVKNLFLNYASKGGVKTLGQEWAKFLASVELAGKASSAGETSWLSAADFLQIIYASTWGDIKGSNLLAPYRSLLTGATPVAVTDLMTYICSQAELLAEIISAPTAWGQGQHRLAYLLRAYLNNKFSLTLALALRSRYAGNSSEFLWGLTLVNSYVFRRFVVGKDQLGTYAANVSSFARRVRWGGVRPPGPAPAPKKEVAIGSLDGLAREMRRASSDRELQNDLLKFRPGSNRLGFYIAYMMEVGAARASSKAPFPAKHPDLRDPKTHLEHILPRAAWKPGSPWAPLKLNRAEVATISAMWGNLLVLPGGVNSAIQDADIATKTVAYRSGACASLELPKAVAASKGTTWDETAITSREHTLATKYAKLAWPLPRTLAEAKAL